MIEFYPAVRMAHIACVILSGALFALRGVLVLAGFATANQAALRYLSYTIDTLLLSAALMLSAMLNQFPFVHGWLTVKVLLLVLYIVLGTYALKRGRTARVRALAFFAALIVYAAIIGVARAHHPLGWWHVLTH